MPIIVYSIFYNVVSLAIGISATRLFRMPAWTTPAIAFNNTNSLPLLLVQALSTTGILDTIDNSSSAVARAKSYFLINATVRNCLTFTLGPKLLNAHDDEPNGQEPKTDEDLDAEIDIHAREAEESDEQTSLLPSGLARTEARTYYATYRRTSHLLRHHPWLQQALDTLAQFLNAPVIGASIAALIGLVPALHRLFFATQQEGGYLNAWLTSALSNVGDLFVALQVVVIGVKLSVAVLRFKKGEASGTVPWSAFGVIILMRFLVWPALSIGLVYALASRTGLLSEDRVLWFAMMLMPCGPSALNLTALADVAGDGGEEEKLGIAKVLTAEYVVSPLVCLAVVGSLKACQAVGGGGGGV